MLGIDVIKSNLHTLLRHPEQIFALEKDGKTLKPADVPDPRVSDIVKSTFEEANDLEPTTKRIWIKIDGKECSVGSVFSKHPSLFQYVDSFTLREEKREFITLKINEVTYNDLDLHCLKVSSKIVKDLIESIDCIDQTETADSIDQTETADSIDQTETADSIDNMLYIEGVTNNTLIEAALKHLQGQDLPKKLDLNDYLEILRFAHFLEAPKLLNDCLAAIHQRDLEFEQLRSLPIELQELVVKGYREKKAEDLLKALPDKDPLIHFCINQGLISITNFKNRDHFLSRVNTIKIRHLSLNNTNLTSECLNVLLSACPNLQNLLLMSCHYIKTDALKHLQHTPKLQTLFLWDCPKLETDALKHLQHTPQLKYLQIYDCGHFEPDALKHLQHTPQLEELEIYDCDHFEPDALKYLQHTPQLKYLNINWCDKLESDALKHLQYTPQLKKLKMDGCDHFEPDALKHLQHTPQLEELKINGCDKLESDALKHLRHTPQLKKLWINSCDQLDIEPYGGLLASVQVIR